MMIINRESPLRSSLPSDVLKCTLILTLLLLFASSTFSLSKRTVPFADAPVEPANFKELGRQIEIEVQRDSVEQGVPKQLRFPLRYVPYVLPNDVISVKVDGSDRTGWVVAMAFVPVDGTTSWSDKTDYFKSYRLTECDGWCNFNVPTSSGVRVMPVIMIAKEKKGWADSLKKGISKHSSEVVKGFQMFKNYSRVTTVIDQVADFVAGYKPGDGTADTQTASILDALAGGSSSAAVTSCYAKEERSERRVCLANLFSDSLIKLPNGDPKLVSIAPLFQALGFLLPGNYLQIIQTGAAIARYIAKKFDQGYEFRMASGRSVGQLDGGKLVDKLQLRLEKRSDEKTVQVYVPAISQDSDSQFSEGRSDLKVRNSGPYCSKEFEAASLVSSEGATLLKGQFAHNFQLFLDGFPKRIGPIDLILSKDGKFRIQTNRNGDLPAEWVNLEKNKRLSGEIFAYWGLDQFSLGKVIIISRQDQTGFELFLRDRTTSFIDNSKDSQYVILKLIDEAIGKLCVDANSVAVYDSRKNPLPAPSPTLLPNGRLQVTVNPALGRAETGHGTLSIRPVGESDEITIQTPLFAPPPPTIEDVEVREGDQSLTIRGTGDITSFTGVVLREADGAGTSFTFDQKESEQLDGQKFSVVLRSSNGVSLKNGQYITAFLKLDQDRGEIRVPNKADSRPKFTVKAASPSIAVARAEPFSPSETSLQFGGRYVTMDTQIRLKITVADASRFTFSKANSQLQFRFKPLSGNKGLEPGLLELSKIPDHQYLTNNGSREVTIILTPSASIGSFDQRGQIQVRVKDGAVVSNWLTIADEQDQAIEFVRTITDLKLQCTTGTNGRAFKLQGSTLASMARSVKPDGAWEARKCPNGENCFLITERPTKITTNSVIRPRGGVTASGEKMKFLIDLYDFEPGKLFNFEIIVPQCP